MLTLQELKHVVSNREERRKVPSAKYLRENDVAVAKQRLMDCAEIIAYQTGYVLYCVGDYATVFPFYFLSRELIGSSNAATGMCLLMLPAFLFAMYEKDGLPLEKVLKNVITVKFIRPPVRKYEVENLYEKKKILTKAKGGTVRGKIKKR